MTDTPIAQNSNSICNLSTTPSRLDTALAYARLGWYVIPLHHIDAGKCSCGNSACESPGKHPRTINGLKNATVGEHSIRHWWKVWPKANIGIVTGPESGIWGLDIDPRNRGEDSLDTLLKENGSLPQTLRSQTGGGGCHYVFAWQDGIASRKGFRPGIDVKAAGGYIVAPPSNHISGGVYQWSVLKTPAKAPPWLIEVIARPKPAGEHQTAKKPAVAHVDDMAHLLSRADAYTKAFPSAGEGERNDSAFRLAGHLAALDQIGCRLSEAQIVEFMTAWNGRCSPPLSDEELRRTVASAMKNGTPRQTKPAQAKKANSPPIEPYQSFPVETLPDPARGFVVAGAKAIGCDPSFIALPLLAMLGAAVGNTRQIYLKRGWTAPPILWTAIVGESGTQKSVGWKTAKRATAKRQAQAIKQHAAEMDAYQVILANYEKRLSEWKRDRKTREAPPVKPKPPEALRYSVEDVTVEALAPILQVNPRGLVLARDELAGWFASFNQYKQGKGADSSHWLSMYNGESMLVDRKTGDRRTIFVPSAAVAVTGGIQPATFHRALGAEHRESGLLARILVTCPPRTPKRWTEAIIDPEAELALERVVNRLYDDLDFGTTQEGDPCPILVKMTSEAKRRWIEFYNPHNKETAACDGDLAAAWSKLEEIPARLALIFHFVRWAADDQTLEHSENVDARSMAPAIELTQWFKQETRRVYGILSQTEESRARHRLVEWIQGKGGRVGVREVQQGHRQFKTAVDAELALQELVDHNFGQWVNSPKNPKGGPATRVFQLSRPSTVYTTPLKSEENGSFVDVDIVDTPDDDELGEI